MGITKRESFWGGLATACAAGAGAGYAGAFGDMIVPFTWSLGLTALCSVGFIVFAVLWARAHFGPEGQLDLLKGWSLSIRPGNPAVAARNGKLDRYLLQMSQFYNLSKDQAREVDLELHLPYYDSTREAVRLTKTRTQDLEYEDVWKDGNPRYAENLTLPITVPPNGKQEGRIEFEVPPGIDVSDIDWSSPVVVVTEKRAGRSITIIPDHVYDGRNGRQYRGGLHSPFPKEAQRDLLRLKALAAHISRD